MSKSRASEAVMLAEQVLELRHAASGTFLDSRGFLADYIRFEGFLPHWKIDSNVVAFRDGAKKVEREGAFAGYRSLGYFTYDPGTGNFFVDRAAKFLKLMLSNQHYKIPPLSRFGARTKVFLPSRSSFADLRDVVYQRLYTEEARGALLGEHRDVKFIAELQEGGFEVRVAGGPVDKGEVSNYLNFDSEHFESCGLFLDLDYYKSNDLKSGEVGKLLRGAQEQTWKQVDSLARLLGV